MCRIPEIERKMHETASVLAFLSEVIESHLLDESLILSTAGRDGLAVILQKCRTPVSDVAEMMSVSHTAKPEG